TTAANDFEANLLWGAVVVANAAACSATAFVAPDADDLLQASQTPLTNSTATTAFHLDAAGANPVTVCFELELDEDAPESVMGLTGEPYWWFDATSIEP